MLISEARFKVGWNCAASCKLNGHVFELLLRVFQSEVKAKGRREPWNETLQAAAQCCKAPSGQKAR